MSSISSQFPWSFPGLIPFQTRYLHIENSQFVLATEFYFAFRSLINSNDPFNFFPTGPTHYRLRSRLKTLPQNSLSIPILHTDSFLSIPSITQPRNLPPSSIQPIQNPDFRITWRLGQPAWARLPIVPHFPTTFLCSRVCLFLSLSMLAFQLNIPSSRPHPWKFISMYPFLTRPF